MALQPFSGAFVLPLQPSLVLGALRAAGCPKTVPFAIHVLRRGSEGVEFPLVGDPNVPFEQLVGCFFGPEVRAVCSILVPWRAPRSMPPDLALSSMMAADKEFGLLWAFVKSTFTMQLTLKQTDSIVAKCVLQD